MCSFEKKRKKRKREKKKKNKRKFRAACTTKIKAKNWAKPVASCTLPPTTQE